MQFARISSVALVFLLAGGAARGSTAAMFRADVRHTGTYGDAPRAYAGIQWRFSTGGAVRSSPVVSGGTVYVGSTDGYVYAIDETSGELHWKARTGAPVTASAAVSSGIVYIASHDGIFHAYETATGKELWRTRFGPDAALAWGHESGDFYDSSALVTSSRVYVGSGDAYVYALDPHSGRVLWRAKTGGRVRSSPASDGKTIYAGSFDGRLYAFDAQNGSERWNYATEGAALRSGDFGYDRRSIQASPALADGSVFFGARDGFVYALDAANGTRRWRFDHHISWSNTSPAVRGSIVFAGTSDGRFIQALDERTGAERWRFTTESNVFASPSLSGSVVYAADWAGFLYAIDATSGKELWRQRITPQRIFSTPAIAGGRIFIGSDDGSVTAYNLTARSLRRAVYFDKSQQATTLSAGEQAAAYFERRGYERLDAAQLAEFLRSRTGDGEASVIVFAQDTLPDGVSGDTVRAYLQSGGKMVWLGMPPGMMDFDEKAGGFVLPLYRDRAAKMLGISYERGNFDLLSAHAVAAGERWGLRGWWVSNYSADPQSVSTVLATDEQGLAAAYVKSYGGPPGSGFVRIPLISGDGGYPLNLDQVQAAAEYFPRS